MSAPQPPRQPADVRALDQANGLPVPDALLERLADLVAERVAAQLPDRPDPWLDVAGAAEHLAAPKSRIYELVERGRLRAYRDGRRLLFRRADLDAALEPPKGAG